ncbi:UNVERIFIED_CONTAM: Xanthotoxin 5-hydroxylase CYP82C4 [Sesamum radiatum]|uniref:Xanthotoxin 5-hydroxylase CYP82C4 n=1 Tax=Sesamum radiatum TaxID=300843 RepID=A0AAW2RGM2_SESRA
MMLGGSDTTTVTLTWALCLLLNNQHALKRAQEELDEHIGRERLVKESDLENLVYIKAIIKETLRIQPSAPLLSPRESVEDCTVAGYHIPAGTRLIVNMWKLHQDPRVWDDPLEFRSERSRLAGPVLRYPSSPSLQLIPWRPMTRKKTVPTGSMI